MAAILVAARARENYNSNNDPNPVVVQKIAKTVEGVGHTFHGFGKIPAEKCKKIDFVFVTPQIQVERSFIPANVEGQPGKNLSDHNPQIVKVSF